MSDQAAATQAGAKAAAPAQPDFNTFSPDFLRNPYPAFH